MPLQSIVIDEEGSGVELEPFVIPFVSGITCDAAEAEGPMIYSLGMTSNLFTFAGRN